LCIASIEDLNIGRRNDNERNNEARHLKDKVTFVYGDRDEFMEYAKLLRYTSDKLGITEGGKKKWDLVVDFCAYNRRHIKSIVRGLSNRTKLYIYISTDSVYEACQKEIRSGLIVETDSVRPEKNEDIEKLAALDLYGHNKLRCEEYLATHVKNTNSLPYVCFRLPDVIGPYDNTNRYWPYLMWLQTMEKYPIHTQDQSKTKKLSFVFSEDVAGFTVSLIPRLEGPEGESFIRSIHGHSFNMACPEAATLNELLQKMVHIW